MEEEGWQTMVLLSGLGGQMFYCLQPKSHASLARNPRLQTFPGGLSELQLRIYRIAYPPPQKVAGQCDPGERVSHVAVAWDRIAVGGNM
jgi:hypothetical protein